MKRYQLWLAMLAAVALAATLTAGGARAEGPRHEVYGFAMVDMGYMGTAVDPKWFDTMRPSKLPAFKDEFGKDGQTFVGMRQSKLGVKSWIPVGDHELRTTFEFDLYGVGVDAGQTTIRPRIMYGEWGKWGGGQIMSPFMDVDVFPNCLDYWGPGGMLFFRNPQIRWMPLQGDRSVTLALERPGASGDLGVVQDSVVSGSIIPSYTVPDLSGNARLVQKWVYVQLGGIVRRIGWTDMATTPTTDRSGSVTGWGVQLSSNITRFKDSVVRLQGVYGEGIQNYFNDAPVDVAAGTDAGSPRTGFIKGVALPITGVTAFIDHTWNPKFTSTFGYSQNVIDNSDLQHANAFHMGQYALANLLYTPDPKIMGGAEVGYEKRTNNADGFTVDNWVLHISLKYNFSGTFGGGQ